jgi:hypothetical protein
MTLLKISIGLFGALTVRNLLMTDINFNEY